MLTCENMHGTQQKHRQPSLHCERAKQRVLAGVSSGTCSRWAACSTSRIVSGDTARCAVNSEPTTSCGSQRRLASGFQ